MFKMRILITMLMLFKCSLDDIKTGYVDMRIIIPATIFGGCVFIVEDIIFGRGLKRLCIYSLIAICIITSVTMRYIVKNYLVHRNSINTSVAYKYLGKCNFKIIDKYVGMGDVIVFTSIAIIMGFRAMVVTAFIAFLISSIYSIYLIISKHVGRQATFPFVPFILMGFIFESI